MAVVNQAVAGTVGVLLGNADGSFQPGVSYAAGANTIDAAAGDMNGDGKLDLVVVGSSVSVLLGNGDGTFGAPMTFPIVGLAAHSVKVGDFNNDGKLDVGTVSNNSASVYLGNGDGTLQPGLNTAVPGNNINLVVGDYDHDGNLDMATSDTVSVGTINVLKGHGDGSFDPVQSYDAFSAPVYLAGGDFNHDGYEDFVVPNSYAQTSMSVIMNNGDGTYYPPHTYGIGQTGEDVEVADFNNDGNDDIAIRGANEYMLHLGKGDGTFYPEVTYSTPAGRFEAGTHGDFNGDGAVDFAYPSFGGVTVVTNDNADFQDLAGAVTFRVTAPATTTSGSVLPMTIAAVDANGNVATGFLGTIYISSSDPAATTAAGYAFNPADAGIPYTFTAADAGTHTFTGAIRLVTGGDQTVTVAAPSMTPATSTVTVTGQVTHLSVGSAGGHERRRRVHDHRGGGSIRRGASPRGTPARCISPARTSRRGCRPTTHSRPPTPASTPSPSPWKPSSGPCRASAPRSSAALIGGGTTVSVTPAVAPIVRPRGRRRGHRRLPAGHRRRPGRLRQRRDQLLGHGPRHQLRPLGRPAGRHRPGERGRDGQRHPDDGRHADADRDRRCGPDAHRHGLQRRHPAGRRPVPGRGLPGEHGGRLQHVHRDGPRHDRPDRDRLHRHHRLLRLRRPGRAAIWRATTFTCGRRRHPHILRHVPDGGHPVDHRTRLGRVDRPGDGNHHHPGRVRRLPRVHSDRRPRRDAGHGRRRDSDQRRRRGGRLRQYRRHGLRRYSRVQQHRHQGDPAGHLHVHGRRRGHAHLQYRPAHRDPQRRGPWSVSVLDASKTPASLATIPGFEVTNGAARQPARSPSRSQSSTSFKQYN